MCFLVRTAAELEARPLFGSLWLFYVKMVGRANSNDLEIPDGEKSRIYFLRLSFSKVKICECNAK